MIGSCILLTISGCSKNEEKVTETTPQETVNEFAINQQVQVDVNVNSNDNTNVNSNISDTNSDNLNSNDSNIQYESIPEGVYEESLKAELDESLAVQESEEYEEYINSDERIEIYMNYDRTEGDNLVLYYSVDETERVENTLKISEVTEGIDELSQGDEVCVVCNGAFSEDGTEFVKVYKVINVTAEEAEAAAAEEAEFEGDHEDTD